MKRDIPEASIEIMLASLADSSIKQYDVCLKKWFLFCQQNSVDMYKASVSSVIEFLTKIFHIGNQYGSLNSHRAALSLINPDTSKDDRIQRFWKGVYRLRPPLPKYNLTWDTSIVLDSLTTWYPNENISLEQLSKKCITLLALVTAHRVQTISKINITNIETQTTQIIIKIPDLMKTSRRSSKQAVLVLPFYPERPEICPAKTLGDYMKRTSTLRKCDNLLISFKKPYKAVSTHTLSRWIKSSLQDSGIDVTIFTAHSTRHAATSRAYKQGVNLDLIRKTAGWSGTSDTFGKFYNRTIVNSNISSLA